MDKTIGIQDSKSSKTNTLKEVAQDHREVREVLGRMGEPVLSEGVFWQEAQALLNSPDLMRKP